jgi:GalNAc5-diNAcBac-PP-undecaprenol beta-1,3-glucosyltransferase
MFQILSECSMGHLNADGLKISVVIITCERPDYLKSSLESVFSQVVDPFEVIVVDDCSVANYQDVLDQFHEKSFKYQRLNQRSGANTARNTGVALSSGDIVAFLDDDDIWLDNFLAAHSKCYSKDNSIGAVICGHRILGNESKVNVNPLTLITADELRHGNRFSGMSGFSAKREILTECPFDINLKNGQDWDLFVRLIQNNIKFVNIPQGLFLYRLATPGGITAKAKKMVVADIEPRLLSAQKHRVWLGEKSYKKRVAEQVLSFLPLKKNKLSWIKKSIELVGLNATIRSLMQQVIRKLTK